MKNILDGATFRKLLLRPIAFTRVVWRLTRSDTPNIVVTPCAPADQSQGSSRVYSSWAPHSF